MRLLVTVLALGTGCSSIFGLESPVPRGDSGVADSLDDAAPDGPQDACVSFSTFVDTCEVQFGADAELPSFAITFNTDTKQFSGFGANVPTLDVMGPAGPITFIVVEQGTIAAFGSLRIVGSRAAGILSNSTITISGSLDVGNGGAAARAACGSAMGEAEAGGAGGGGGGSFWGAGGMGGSGGNGDANGGAGAPAQARPASPIGGCAGSAGGAGTTPGGAGGLGGGGVILIARTSITIGGTISANGQGGRGGTVDSGGAGGGGAGGMIMLEAPAITISGVLAANGGAGGEGAAGSAGANGADGPNSASRAIGGSGSAANGGDGGLGGAGTTLDGSAPTNIESGGGGGGGGGVGFIVAKTPVPVTMSTGIVSPSLTILP